MKCVALVKGRGNNTLKDKNIRLVNGYPLVYYPARAAKDSKFIDYFYVTSDDDKILEAVEELNYTKIKRPSELGKPDSQAIDVVKHAVEIIKNDIGDFHILIVLMANSATVLTEWIDEGINFIKNNPSIDSVVPVYAEQDHHPYRAKRMNQDGFIENYFDFTKQSISSNRQFLPKNFFLCHNFWILNMANDVINSEGQKPWTFLGNTIKPIIVEGCFDVHTEEDLIKTGKWLDENSNKV